MGGKCGCLAAIGIILTIVFGGLWLRSKGGLDAALRQSELSGRAQATMVAQATADYTQREIARAVMTQSAHDIEIVGDVSNNAIDGMRDVSVAASAASVVASISSFGTALLVILGVFLVLIILAKLGGA